MLGALVLSIALILAPGGADAPPEAPRDEVLRALYERGRTFDDFVGGARRRVELWQRLSAEGAVADAWVERARAVGGTWRILAVAEDWCGDSAYNLPYVARLVEAVDGLDLRIVNSSVGRALMESHRTPDGRAATPTFLLLDGAWEEAGCFVERPSPLMAWYLDHRTSLDTDALHEHIVDFYESDGGSATVADVVALLEEAAAGRPRCVVGSP